MFKLEKEIRKKAKQGHIQLMTHLVLGYPNLETSSKLIAAMAETGVELVEMQIPFTEPIADGATIVRANQAALDSKISVEDCFRFADEQVKKFPSITFVYMTYTNILFRSGFENFVRRAADSGVVGAIVPDLPPENARQYFEAAQKYDFSPVQIYTPTTSEERMKYLNQVGQGMHYCMGRKGVTGKKTELDAEFWDYIGLCKKNSSLPLGVGFGIRDKEAIEILKDKVEIAILGSVLIEIFDKEGVEGVRRFLKDLKPAQT